MCGIVGIIAKESQGLFGYDEDTFENLLISDSIRGKDSTGVFGITRHNEAHILKQGTDALTFVQMPEWDKFKTRIRRDFQFVIGHNRKATTGSITSDNAHPFKEGHIILVHNGSVENHKALKDTEVDSQALCHSFATQGVKTTLQSIHGAFALVWYDLKEKALYLWRNEQRPLEFCHSNNRLYLASEVDMLKWILSRENRTIFGSGSFKPKELIRIKFSPFSMDSEYLPQYVTTPYVQQEYIVKDEVCKVETNLESSTSKLLEVRESYPFDSPTIFFIHKYEMFMPEPLQYRLVGTAFRPGSKPIPAEFYPPRNWSEDDCKKLVEVHDKKLTGIVERVLGFGFKNGGCKLHLKDVKIPDSSVSMLKGTIPDLEWELICNKLKCSKCDTLMQGKNHQADVTSLSTYGGLSNNYNVICADCLTASVPAEKHDKLFQSRNTPV